MDQPLGEKVIKNIKSDYVIQGAHRIHNWYAFAIIGIVFGMAVGIIYVANRNAQFDASQAMITEPPSDTENTVVFDTLLNRYVEERGNPATVRILPVKEYTVKEGPDNDIIALNEAQEFPFNTEIEQNIVKNFLAGLSIGYDFFIGQDPQGYLAMKGALAKDSDIYQNLISNPMMLNDIRGNIVITTEGKNCSCPKATISYGEAKPPQDVDARKDEIQFSCDVKASDGSNGSAAECLKRCDSQIETANTSYFIGPIPDFKMFSANAGYKEKKDAYEKELKKYQAEREIKYAGKKAPACDNKFTSQIIIQTGTK